MSTVTAFQMADILFTGAGALAKLPESITGNGVKKPLVRDRISCFTFARESSRSALVIRFPLSLAVLLLVRVGVGLRAPRRD